MAARCSIYLMRHGQAVPPGLLTGQSDYALTPEGEAQMRAWAGFFAPIPLDAVWSSPLLRARQSAALVAKALLRPVPADHFFLEPDFTEISVGVWEGLSKEEIMRDYPEEWMKRGSDFMNFAPPGGENFATLSRRVVPALRRLYGEFGKLRHVLIVAHQAVNRAILAELGAPCAGSWLDIPQDLSALNELALSKTPSGNWICSIISVNAGAPPRGDAKNATGQTA